MAKYDDTSKMQYIDLTNWLLGYILLRVPLLDKEAFDVAKKINTVEKLKDHIPKYAFRKVAEKFLPKQTSGKKKLGFPVPIRVWLKQDSGYGRTKAMFTGESAGKFFNQKQIMQLLDDHKAGIRDNSRKIWVIYTFLIWYQVFFVEKEHNFA